MGVRPLRILKRVPHRVHLRWSSLLRCLRLRRAAFPLPREGYAYASCSGTSRASATLSSVATIQQPLDQVLLQRSMQQMSRPTRPPVPRAGVALQLLLQKVRKQRSTRPVRMGGRAYDPGGAPRRVSGRGARWGGRALGQGGMPRRGFGHGEQR